MLNEKTVVIAERIFDIECPIVSVTSISSAIEIKEREDGKSQIEIIANKEIEGDLSDFASIESHGDRIIVTLDKHKGRRFFFGASHRLSNLKVVLSIPKKSEVEAKSVSAVITLLSDFNKCLLTSVSGDICVMKNASDRNEVRTVSGDISVHTFTGTSHSLKTVSGSINVFIVPGLDLDVNGSTLSGDTKSEFDLNFETNAGKTSDNKATNLVAINASTVSGDILLRREPVKEE